MCEDAAIWHPAAVAIPSITAITGFGLSAIVRIISAQASNSSPRKATPSSSSDAWRLISFRSCPAQKIGPGPCSRITRAASSDRAASSADWIARIIDSDSGCALPFIRVRVNRPSVRSVATRSGWDMWVMAGSSCRAW